MKKLLVLLVALIPVAASASADAGDAAAVALSFYRAYAGSDLDGALSFWSPQSPAADATQRRVRRFLRVHCLELGRLEAMKVDVAGDDATVDVEAEWLDTSNMPDAVPNADFGDGKVALRRDAGRWRIVDWTPAATAFAEALVNGDESILANPRVRCRAVVRAMARRAITLVNKSQFETAQHVITAAQRIAEDIGDDAARSLAASAEATLGRHWPHTSEAPPVLADRSIALAQRSADADALARAYLARGAYFERALALGDFVSDPALLAIAASRMAAIYNDLGDHWRSLQFSSLSLRYAEETQDASAMINAEFNIAATYDYYNDRPLAIAHTRAGGEIARRAGFFHFWSDALINIADFEIELGHCARAKTLIDEAAEDPSKKMVVLLLHARCAPTRTETDRYLAQASRLMKTSDDWQAVAAVMQTLIDEQLDRGRPAAALEILQRLTEIQGGRVPMKFEHEVLNAEIQRRLGHTDAALRAANAAIEIAEQQRTKVLGDERQQRSFSTEHLRVYGELVTIRVDAGQTFAALTAADDAKGRTLLDILRSRRSTFHDVMNDDERSREHVLREHAAALRRQVEAAPAASRAALADQLQQSRLDVDVFEADMAIKYPAAVPKWAPPAPIDETTLRALLPDSSTAILEFMVTDDRLHAFVVRRDAAGRVRVRVRSTPMRSAALRRRVTRYVAALARADVDYRAEARKLYELLLAPLEPQLAGVRVACIVPDGPLWQLPFETLLGRDGRFFVEHAAPFYVPSIAVYARMRAAEPRRGAGTLFAMADPVASGTRDAAVSRLRAGESAPLPDAAREVRAAARILGGRSAVYVGASASLRRLEDEAADYRVLHFATHGVLDDADPMYSHLVLAPSGAGDDGVLDAWQMMRLHLNAELAVLSACDTARGGDSEGLVGMSWALFVAGCPSTIATHWKIASAPAADLVIDFYRHWAALGGRPFAKATALANAQRAMLRQRGRRHPFFWAPFILVGAG